MAEKKFLIMISSLTISGKVVQVIKFSYNLNTLDVRNKKFNSIFEMLQDIHSEFSL